jgi:hypothetical protein
MRLSMRGVFLGCSTQAEKHPTENVRQSFHLVNPPEIKICWGGGQKKSQGDAPFTEQPQLSPNLDRLPSMS